MFWRFDSSRAILPALNLKLLAGPGFVQRSEDIMSMHLDPSRDLGLQNILQAGASYLRGSLSEEDGRHLLPDLISIFTDANSGSARLNVHMLAVSRDEQVKLDNFSIFVRFLAPTYGDDLSRELQDATRTLRGLSDGSALPEQRSRVAGLIDDLLAAMKRQRALRPLHAPLEKKYG